MNWPPKNIIKSNNKLKLPEKAKHGPSSASFPPFRLAIGLDDDPGQWTDRAFPICSAWSSDRIRRGFATHRKPDISAKTGD
jgi:hypothetical protein